MLILDGSMIAAQILEDWTQISKSGQHLLKNVLSLVVCQHFGSTAGADFQDQHHPTSWGQGLGPGGPKGPAPWALYI